MSAAFGAEEVMSERFQDLGESVLDTNTGLEWQKTTPGKMSWEKAMRYAKGLSLGGHSDWRLPSVQELTTLVDYEKNDPASSFPGMASNWCWSSSSFSGSSSLAWFVNFDVGNASYLAKTYSNYVRCIRRAGA